MTGETRGQSNFIEQKKIERGRQTIFQSRLKNLIEKDSFWFRLEFFKNIFCF